MKIDNWKICHWLILAVYLKDFFCRQGQSQEMRILQIDNYDHCCFCNHDSTHFSILRVSANDYYSRIFDSFIFIHKSNRFFFPSKGLLCLYDKQNNTWLLVDMEFLFSCSTRHLTRSLRSLVSYRVKHSKRNSISTRAHVLFSIYHINCGVIQGFPALRKAVTTHVKKYRIFSRVLI